MKSLPILLVIAALAAFVFAPVNFEIAASFLFGAGFVSILIGDYSRRALLLERRLVPALPELKSPLGLAA